MYRLLLLPDQVNDLPLKAKHIPNQGFPFQDSSESEISLMGDVLICNGYLFGIDHIWTTSLCRNGFTYPSLHFHSIQFPLKLLPECRFPFIPFRSLQLNSIPFIFLPFSSNPIRSLAFPSLRFSSLPVLSCPVSSGSYGSHFL